MVPGVLIDENAVWPPPIEAQDTAVPVFIGYTTRAESDTGESLLLTPTRIASLVDYEQVFGGPVIEPVSVALRTNRQRAAGVDVQAVDPHGGCPAHIVPWAVRHYFDNGGTACFIVSVGVGDPAEGPDAGALRAGIDAAEQEPSITMLLVPDAATLPAWSAYRDVAGALLAHAARLRRFGVLDVWQGDQPLNAMVDVAEPGAAAVPTRLIDASRSAWPEHLSHGAAYYPFVQTAYPRLSATPDASVSVTIDGVRTLTLDALKDTDPKAAAAARAAIDGVPLVLPPSAAVAGVYAHTDRTRGVWKAPANVSLNNVVRPMVPMTDSQQQGLTTDLSGKSVNAIRLFTGKGTLVWGARTLAGNDHEWRYVSVRRVVDAIERSVLASTQWVVFEPNDTRTWSALVSSVETYLTLCWRQGALLGAKPEEAFWVRCGRGQTMTDADVAAGVIHLTMALALVRPTEFQLVGLSYRVLES